MKIVLSGVLVLLLIGTGLSQGISFIDGSWEDALKLAEKENKYIMVDAYTDWCGWCKHMDKKTFSTKEAGDFYNENYISVKIDMEKSPGIELGQKYRVTGYPSYLFFKPNGDYAYKAVGFMGTEEFIEKGKEAIKNPYALKSNAKNLNLNLPDFYYKAFTKNRKDRVWPDRELVSAYLDSLPDLFSEEAWSIMFRLSTMEKHEQFVADNREKYTELFGNEEVQKKLDKVLYNILKVAIKNKDEEKLNLVMTKIDDFKYDRPERTKLIYKIHYYEQIQDWKKYANSIDVFIPLSEEVETERINEYSWNIYKKVDDEEVITKAISWMEKVIEEKSQYAYIDTYAALFFKLNDFKNAKIYAEKAIEIGKEDNEDIKGTEELLEKINAELDK